MVFVVIKGRAAHPRVFERRQEALKSCKENRKRKADGLLGMYSPVRTAHMPVCKHPNGVH